jgi:hypothetical protein
MSAAAGLDVHEALAQTQFHCTIGVLMTFVMTYEICK